MSSRARRIDDGAHVRRFDWLHIVGGADEAEVSIFDTLAEPQASPHPVLSAVSAPPPSPTVPSAEIEAQLAALEREAFAKGYASGERAGVEAGTRRADAMLRRMAQTIEDISQLRKTMVHQTERQMVQLALLLAKRVVGRELALDVELVAAMAHVALERLGESGPATIRLNPEDYAALVVLRGEAWEGAQVAITPDPALPRGGCVVDSEFGRVDASIEAQLGELSRALLGDPHQHAHVLAHDDGNA
jgi:flagellar assembly protein FliH